LTKRNRKYFDAVLLSNPESDMCPSILLMVMRIVGRIIRNSFKAIPGKKPCIIDLREFLQLSTKIRFRKAASYKHGAWTM
jgi:hypothetical protein